MTLFWLFIIVVATVVGVLVMQRRLTPAASLPAPADAPQSAAPSNGARSAPRGQPQAIPATAPAQAPAEPGFEWDAAVFEIAPRSDRTAAT